MKTRTGIWRSRYIFKTSYRPTSTTYFEEIFNQSHQFSDDLLGGTPANLRSKPPSIGYMEQRQEGVRKESTRRCRWKEDSRRRSCGYDSLNSPTTNTKNISTLLQGSFCQDWSSQNFEKKHKVDFSAGPRVGPIKAQERGFTLLI